MPIAATDIITRFSVAAAAGETSAGSAATSLGDQVSTTAWADGAVLFDDISGAENAASESEYRCIFVLNNHATLTLQNAVVYLAAEVAGGASVAIGVDPTAVSAKGSASAQAVAVANEDTAPAGVTFTAPTTAATGLALGNLGPGQVRGVWIRRTAANSVALNNDGFTLGIAGDTAA